MKILKVIFKILWILVFVFLILVFFLLYYRDWIGTQLAEKEIRDTLGLEAETGNLTVGVMEPKVTFENLKLYNTTNFGGTLFLDIKELHMEYDLAALRQHKIHITFMRLNVSEVDVVKNNEGETNIYSIARAIVTSKPGGGGRSFTPVSGFQFEGIDSLNVSIGVAKFVDMKNHLHDRALALGIQNQVISNIKSPEDLGELENLIWIRGGRMVGLPFGPPKQNRGINISGAPNTPTKTP